YTRGLTLRDAPRCGGTQGEELGCRKLRLDQLEPVARRVAHEDAGAVAIDRDAGRHHRALDRGEVVDDEADMRPLGPGWGWVERLDRQMELHGARVVPCALVLARAGRLRERVQTEQRAVEVLRFLLQVGRDHDLGVVEPHAFSSGRSL